MSKRNHSRSAAPYAKGYSEAGASVTRRALKGFTPDSGSPNEDINRNNATLRQRSRMLYMASPVATSAINTNRTKVVGTGLTLKATVDRDLLGLLETMVSAYVSSKLRDMIAYLVMILILVFIPNGLLGKSVKDKL